MADNLNVLESADLGAKPVRTAEIAGVHYPIYILADSNGVPLHSLNGALDTHDAHVHHKVVNTYFHRIIGAGTTIGVAASAGDTSITLADATGFIVGDTLHVGNGTRETTEPQITIVVGNVVTLDRPLDFSWAVGSPVYRTEENMQEVVGSLATPVIYEAIPDTSEVWHIESIVLNMIMTTAADDSLFGNLPALTNGCLLRGYDGTTGNYRTFTNWKSNRDIKLDLLDTVYSDKAGAGQFGVTGDGALARRTGAVPELSGANGDKLELWVQDDITGISSFKMKAQGHVEGE